MEWKEQQQEENWKILTYAEIRELLLQNQRFKEEIKREIF